MLYKLYVIMYIATYIAPGVCICGIIDDDLFVSLIICWLKDWPNQIHAIYITFFPLVAVIPLM